VLQRLPQLATGPAALTRAAARATRAQLRAADTLFTVTSTPAEAAFLKRAGVVASNANHLNVQVRRLLLPGRARGARGLSRGSAPRAEPPPRRSRSCGLRRWPPAFCWGWEREQTF